MSSCSRSKSSAAGGMGGESVDCRSTGGKGSVFTGGQTSRDDEVRGNGGSGEGASGVTTGGESGLGGSGLGGQGNATGDMREEPEEKAPRLISLVVEGGAVAMRPKFRPEILRYAVRAADPEQVLRVLLEANEDFRITVAGIRAESGEGLNLPGSSPGTEIEIIVENLAGNEERYELVYLPNDFPDLVVSTLEREASTDPIYLTLQPDFDYVAKVDNHGVPLFYTRSRAAAQDFKRHSDGRMSYGDSFDQGERVLLNQDYEEIDRIKAVGYINTDRHDFQILDNGNYVVFIKKREIRDVTEFGGVAEQELSDNILQEITPEREVVFEWNTWGHINYNDVVDLERFAQDYAHVNSLDVDAEGNWLVSSRHTSQVLKVNHQTGEVIWRLGGFASDFEFVDDPYNGFCGQHHAMSFPPKTGRSDYAACG